MNNKPGRNDPCPCGSGKKYKSCCWNKELPKTRKPIKATLISGSPQVMNRVYGSAISAQKASQESAKNNEQHKINVTGSPEQAPISQEENNSQ